jgi:hypothetical protein
MREIIEPNASNHPNFLEAKIGNTFSIGAGVDENFTIEKPHSLINCMRVFCV